ncbi:metal-sulfur cluster assembly factor [Dolosicoccus paucivorans]|uniref:Metal-sulfur cluster assembly factor n=1 Tax=Dolosicoccus paucivorans TaxID=84521 RepID=A0A1G8KKG1_9LACT|nr:metal-sulfur cluster assembly factor [Dolosicoccus paucivorans]PMB83647.1 metal-sulfur cluster assembly factor [Dolosicoccus paucivorans]PMC57779.1 metal-sulfur cluster assembly factor [Dolosicoccus paucivorans]SDI43931.1 Metal-sulfur cluster biosynthetic enzyme [Dolosicoccus paucivorans]
MDFLEDDDRQFSELEKQVYIALQAVVDPELGIDVVNLGLIYDVQIDDKGHCDIDLTLTTIACPLAGVIQENVRQEALSVEGVNSCEVEFVWYPPWSPDMMSRYARIALGIR